MSSALCWAVPLGEGVSVCMEGRLSGRERDYRRKRDRRQGMSHLSDATRVLEELFGARIDALLLWR